jgi:hypothetical protein
MLKKIKYSLIIILQLNLISVSAQDLKLWYKQPAIKWTEHYPLEMEESGQWYSEE